MDIIKKETINDENLKILPILCKETVHIIDADCSTLEIICFPLNVTSLIQPCDQGII